MMRSERTDMCPVLSNARVLLPEEALVYENHCESRKCLNGM
jgi:hypothetical protein